MLHYRAGLLKLFCSATPFKKMFVYATRFMDNLELITHVNVPLQISRGIVVHGKII